MRVRHEIQAEIDMSRTRAKYTQRRLVTLVNYKTPIFDIVKWNKEADESRRTRSNALTSLLGAPAALGRFFMAAMRRGFVRSEKPYKTQ
jgi:hypothetical protein